MNLAAFNPYNNGALAFLDLKLHESQLDDSMIRDIEKIEESVAKILMSRKKIASQLDSIFPLLFELRINATKYLSESELSWEDALEKIYPEIEEITENASLVSIGHQISNALAQNRKLVQFFQERGELGEKPSLPKETEHLDFASFVMLIKFMPSQIQRLVFGLTTASLQIEFLAITVLMLKEKTISCSQNRLIELTNLSREIATDYVIHVKAFKSLAQSSAFLEEREQWGSLNTTNLSYAYGIDEPDYDNVTLQEPNPDYEG